MEKYGFVYLWYDRKHKRFYLGKHWGTIEDGYICSSPWMKAAQKRRPQDFRRRIIEYVYSTKKDLTLAENKWGSYIKEEELGKKYYNLVPPGGAHWADDLDNAISIKEKLSLAQKKRFRDGVPESHREALSRAGKGKKKSPGHVAKVAAANKGKNSNEAFRQMRREKMKGKSWATYTPERNAKIASSLRGRPLSEEHRAKLRAGHARRREQLNIENR